MKKLTFTILALFSLLSVMPGFSQVDDGLPLPFLEQWNTGTFETNNWLPEGENWSINGNEGQSDPSAEFTWDPIQSDYQIALESYPLLADSLTEGFIYLDFDLKLDNYLPTGTEQMLVQVWNWDSQTWATVSTYSNEEGSFDWMSEHLNITDEAMGKVFKIRFAATGESSLNILGWFVDNIHVYRECKAPINLEVAAAYIQNEYGNLLEWEKPYGPLSEWIEWDEGVNSGNSIGTGSEIEFDVAARWEPSQLSEYIGSVVERVAFFPAESQAEYRIRVWIGADAANMVVDQLVENPIMGQWNDIILTSPTTIDITQELWVGYHVNTQDGYPVGVDDGPAIDEFGNMMNFGGWQTLLEINPELDYNWNIRAFIHRTQSVDTVAHYAIYLSYEGSPYTLRAYSNEEEYFHVLYSCQDYYLYCYHVTAIYASQLDSCESGPSNEACEISPINVKEVHKINSIKIYPNPASEVLFIESSEKVESVRIFDGRGCQVVGWSGGQVVGWPGGQGKVGIPLDGLAPGLYLVRVDLGDVMINKKIIVKH